MIRTFILAALLALASPMVCAPSAQASSHHCASSSQAAADVFNVGMTCAGSGSGSDAAGTQPTASHGSQPTFEWRLACSDKSTATNTGGAQPCAGNTACPPKQHLYRLWQVTPTLVPMGIQCAARTPRAPTQQLTAAMVARAFQHVPLPGLQTHIQPKDETLVNFDTIFFTDARPLTRTLTLLGQRVTLDIRPSRFTWTFGDGSSETTSVPGAPYPHKIVTHRYPHAHVAVAAHVAVTWKADYSVNGGPARPVDGTVTTTGPDTGLRIAEAVPALSGQGH